MLRLQMAKFGESTNEERDEDEPARPIHVEVGRQPSVCPAVSPHRAGYIETAEQRATEQPRATKRTPLRHKTAGRAVTDSVCVHFCHSARRWAPFGVRPAHMARVRSLFPSPEIWLLQQIFAFMTVSSWPSRRLCLASPAPEAHNSARGSTDRCSKVARRVPETGEHMCARYII